MRKTILILGHSYSTQFIDINNQYSQLFAQDKYEVTVAYLTGQADESIRKRHCAEHVLFLNFSKKSIRGLKIAALYQLYRLCKEKKFTIVICHRYKPSYLMLWVAQFFHIPALFFIMHAMNTVSSWHRKLLIACLWRKNMCFAGVSNAVCDDIKENLWRSPAVVTLYNGIDIERSEPLLFPRAEARKQLGIPQDVFVFGSVGRLVPVKDHKTLIEAFSRLKKEYPLVTLAIIGEGKLASQLKQQTERLGLAQAVIFTGFVPQSFRYMKAFDCFILSSVEEAFGLVLLEAMLAKVPIIATQSNGIPEVVADVGPIVPPENATQLAMAMKQFLQIPAEERLKKGDAGYQRAVKNFSIPPFRDYFWQLPLVHTLKE